MAAGQPPWLLHSPVWLFVGMPTALLYLALFTPLLGTLPGFTVLLLAGVLLPIAYGPAWLRSLAYVDPLYYLVVAARSLAAGTLSSSATWEAFAVLVPLCALTLAWATRVNRRAVA